jgi:polar amino acid transport system substrate-binding protein
LRDLAGKTVGAAWPPALEALAEQAGSVAFAHRSFDSEHEAVAAVVKGEVDALLLDEPLALYHANKNPEYRSLLKTVGAPIVDQGYGIAVKKGNTKVLGQINRALSKVLGSAQEMEIRKRWIE